MFRGIWVLLLWIRIWRVCLGFDYISIRLGYGCCWFRESLGWDLRVLLCLGWGLGERGDLNNRGGKVKEVV